jgi:dihydroorotate dehydrogenase (fumarate)
MGLPNLGFRKYVEFIPQLKKFNKPVIASVSGLKLEDNIEIIKAFNETDVDLIELNLSCPNIVGKPQVGYDPEAVKKTVTAVGKICQKPWGVKLHPYFDFVHYEETADILNHSRISFVTCINSVGNGLVIDPFQEAVVIKPKNGFGGIGGQFIKPIGLGNVRKFRELLKPAIQIIGVGGIISGLDVFEYILAGADAVQLGTIFQQEGAAAFKRIEQELAEVMEQKGYGRIEDFKNKLKVL